MLIEVDIKDVVLQWAGDGCWSWRDWLRLLEELVDVDVGLVDAVVMMSFNSSRKTPLLYLLFHNFHGTRPLVASPPFDQSDAHHHHKRNPLGENLTDAYRATACAQRFPHTIPCI